MPLDFRYHLASLTAVFGALLIGLLLGVAITDAPGLSSQIKGLREEFRKSQALRDIDQRTNQFNLRTQEALVRDRLLGRNVVIVQNASTFPDDKVDEVRNALRQSGATITAEVVLKPSLLQLIPEQLTQLYQRMAIPLPEKPSAASLLNYLAIDLGQGNSVVVPELQKEGYIHAQGDVTVPFSTIIFLGGSKHNNEDTAGKIDLPFLRGCVKRQLRVAATESLEAPRSAMSAYQKVVPITIDNIDRAAGRIALIVALSNNRPGHYGYKNTADDVSPDIE